MPNDALLANVNKLKTQAKALEKPVARRFYLTFTPILLVFIGLAFGYVLAQMAYIAYIGELPFGFSPLWGIVMAFGTVTAGRRLERKIGGIGLMLRLYGLQKSLKEIEGAARAGGEKTELKSALADAQASYEQLRADLKLEGI